MPKFYLTNKAVEDLGDIWDDTVETWSENQAEIYYSLLIDSCQELANQPCLGKSQVVAGSLLQEWMSHRLDLSSYFSTRLTLTCNC